MKMQYVLSEIPDNFNSKGGFKGAFTNQKQLDTKAVVKEAIKMNCVPAYSPTQVKACAIGLLESMIEGVSRDGNPRSMDGFFKVSPVLKGRFEKIDSSYNPKENYVVVNVQLLRELKPVDVSNWSFVNATPSVGSPSEPAPTITGAGTRGDDPGEVNVAGATLDVTGENLEGATQIELLDDSGSLWQTVAATYADGKLSTASLYFPEKPSVTGAVRVTTPAGTATFDVTYEEH